MLEQSRQERRVSLAARAIGSTTKLRRSRLVSTVSYILLYNSTGRNWWVNWRPTGKKSPASTCISPALALEKIFLASIFFIL